MSEGSERRPASPWDPPSGPPGYGPGPQPPPPPPGWQPGPMPGYGPAPQPPPPGWQPGPMPPAYGQPYPPAGYYPPQAAYGGGGQGTNGMAVASLVLGIVGIVFVWVPLVDLVPAVLSMIFGFVAKNQISRHQQAGAGMANAGLVLGWVAIAIQLIFVALAVVDVLLVP